MPQLFKSSEVKTRSFEPTLSVVLGGIVGNIADVCSSATRPQDKWRPVYRADHILLQHHVVCDSTSLFLQAL